MSRKSTTKGPQARETVFRVHAPGARSVYLAGTFNDWEPATHSMEEEAVGDWVLALPLEPGRYEYKFIVDGVWCCDPTADDAAVFDCVPNGVGSYNLTLEVPDPSGDS
jgi:1,4-alpha-glucan branching enzyme